MTKMQAMYKWSGGNLLATYLQRMQKPYPGRSRKTKSI